MMEMKRSALRDRPIAWAVAGSLVAMTLTCGPAKAEEAFNLDALIEAAKKEPPITVYAVTGKIVDTAKEFSEKYGVQATGKKVNEATQVELMIREHQAGNILGDVSVATDVASAIGQLLPEGIATSWTPPDIAKDIPEAQRNPLVVVSDPHVFTYNTEKYDKCPVTNIWQLTEPQWRGKLAMLDLFDKPLYADWFNQIETHRDADVARAYESLYGKKLETNGQSATAAWVKAFAENGPLLADFDNGRERRRRPGTGRAVLRHHLDGEVSRQPDERPEARHLRRCRAVFRIPLSGLRPDRGPDQEPQRRQAVCPLPDDGRGHRTPDRRREDLRQRDDRPAGR